MTSTTASIDKSMSDMSINKKATDTTATASAPLTAEEQLTHVDLSDDKVVDKYKTAGEIVNGALKQIVSLCKPDATIVSLCQAGDDFIEQATSKIHNSSKVVISKGVGFPTCISVNNIVGHYSPMTSDKTSIKAGDMVKIDLAVQLDGYVVSGATTHIVTDKPVEGKLADVLSAAYYAADATYRSLRPGNTNTQVTNIITSIANDYGVQPVAGVLSHNMKRFLIDGEKLILNRYDAEDKQKVPEVKFEAGEVWCIDVVMSTGDGKPKEQADRTTVYMKSEATQYAVKGKITKDVIAVVDKKHKHFPFTLRSVGTEAHSKFAVKELKEHNMVSEYPVLHEKPGVFVAHIKFTALIKANSTDRLTGIEVDLSNVKSDKKVVNEDALKALATDVSKKANKKKSKADASAASTTNGAKPA